MVEGTVQEGDNVTMSNANRLLYGNTPVNGENWYVKVYIHAKYYAVVCRPKIIWKHGLVNMSFQHNGNGRRGGVR